MKTMLAVGTMIRDVEATELAQVEGGTRLDPDSYDRYKAFADAHASLVGGGFFSNEGGQFGTHEVWGRGSLLGFGPKCPK
jgi:hypothetical protein